MKARQPQTSFLIELIFASLSILFISSCATVPRNYPKNKAFVFETTISVEGNLTREEKSRMEGQLENQLDDSMQARSAQKFLKSVLNRPPAFDSSSATRSMEFMQKLLRSEGYYYGQIGYDYTVDTVRDQYRAKVNFNVNPGKLMRLDTVIYKFSDTAIQYIVDGNRKDAVVKKGDAFAKGPMTTERDRLVELFRNSGYLRFIGGDIMGLWDTLDVELLQPSFDPFDQINLFEKIKNRQENPVANLEYRFKPGFDQSHLIKYYNGNVTMYPEISVDSAYMTRKTVLLDSGKFKIVYTHNAFKPKFLRRNFYLKNGDLYRQEDLVKTINRYNALGAWKLVSIEPKPRPNSDTVDFEARLSLANKYAYSITLEGNRNQSAITGDLWGTGINLSFQNRNFARSANHSTTNFRYGVEFGGGRGIQTQQFLLNQNIYFPRLLAPKFFVKPKFRDNARTVFSFGGSVTDRIDYFNQRTVNLSWGYEYDWKNQSITFLFPNFEYSVLRPRDSLISLFNSNPIYKNQFTDGLILSAIFKYNLSFGRPGRLNFFRLNVEESGILFGVIKNKFFDTNLYRFIKVEAEISRKVVMKKWADGTDKNVLALRMMGGIGYELGSTENPNKRNNLPFFKAFYAGGPNSMRAWQLRRLGQGSVVKEFTGTGSTPERFGDVQLEGNIEYRFHMFKYLAAKVNGALFMDVGNIWYLKKDAVPDTPEEQAAVFKFSKLGQDLAVGMGAGLRIDFSLFILRLDYAFKVKDPSPELANADRQNRWFYNIKPLSGTLQLGINYPFVL
jgi:outer membrane protein insertion porin family